MKHKLNDLEIIKSVNSDSLRIFSGSHFIAEVGNTDDSPDTIKEYAAFIVTACNNHEALVEALKLCAEILENIHTGSDDECECWEAADKAKAALARVREGK